MENSQNFNKILKYRKYKMASIANEIRKFPPRKKFIELQIVFLLDFHLKKNLNEQKYTRQLPKSIETC